MNFDVLYGLGVSLIATLNYYMCMCGYRAKRHR